MFNVIINRQTGSTEWREQTELMDWKKTPPHKPALYKQ